MKKIPILQIKEDKGLTLELNEKEPWVVEVLQNIFADEPFDLPSIKGSLHLTNVNRVIHCLGHVEFIHHPQCARCGKGLNVKESVPLNALFAPLTQERAHAIDEKDKLEETEVTDDDTEFNFYTHEEIQIDPVLNDQIALTLQYNYYCKTKLPCQPQLPDDPLISFNKKEDPRWAPLKDLKLVKK